MYYLYKKNKTKNLLKGLFSPFIIIIIIVIIILNPKNIVKAAITGVDIWFYTVLPALLPFFILSEITIKLGIVNFIGSLLSPIMRPLFNVPGEGAFVFAMSITSGYPVGAKLISNLRLENKISSTEAQRLASFCSTSGPLFMIGAVAVGMFNSESLGLLIIVSHYIGAIAVGLIFRFYKHNNLSNYNNKKKLNNIKSSFNNLISEKNFGLLLSQSVQDGMQTILIVGGFIIFYSVIIETIDMLGIISIVSNILNVFNINLDPIILKGLIFGLIEITNGCKILSESNFQYSIYTISLVTFLIGWSGFSIHSQTVSFFSKTDIKSNIYILGKLFHGIISSLFCFILYPFLFNKTFETFNVYKSNILTTNYFEPFIDNLATSFKLNLFIIIILLFSSIIIRLFFNIKRYTYKS